MRRKISIISLINGASLGSFKPSVRARLLNWCLRRTVKKRISDNPDPLRTRLKFQRERFPHSRAGVRLEKVRSPVQGEWHRSVRADGTRSVLYLHGGGYVFGSPKTHRGLTFALARCSGFDVFSLDYRLAPEHPCPAALEDALRAYRWLCSRSSKPERLAVAGDSAGAGLVVALLQALRDAGERLPAVAICYCPFVDLSMSGASSRTNAGSEVLFEAGAYRSAGAAYAGSLSLVDPQVSPLFGDMTGLPPTKSFASTTEVLLDDAKRLAASMTLQGVPAELVLEEGLVHAWPVFPVLPEARATIRASAAFLREHTCPSSPRPSGP